MYRGGINSTYRRCSGTRAPLWHYRGGETPPNPRACFPQDIELFLPTQSRSNSPMSQTSAPTGSSRPGPGLCGCREKPPGDCSVLWLPILDRPQSPGAGTCRRDCAGWSRSSPAWAGTCKTQQRLIVGSPQEDSSVPPKPSSSSPVALKGPSSPDPLVIPLESPATLSLQGQQHRALPHLLLQRRRL